MEETDSNAKTEEGDTELEASIRKNNGSTDNNGPKEEHADAPEATTTKDTDATESTDKLEDSKVDEPKKVKKIRKVMKDKKKTHKVSLQVEGYFDSKIMPHSFELKEESEAKLENLADLDRERQKLEAIKNKVESYIYYIKNKLIDDEDTINSV